MDKTMMKKQLEDLINNLFFSETSKFKTELMIEGIFSIIDEKYENFLQIIENMKKID